ncbi:MAG: NHL repeat-containing protein [Melioribacteraceae bacterium]|nr:NHL repeat-containing protein [Melioribacteraceae bacterium]
MRKLLLILTIATSSLLAQSFNFIKEFGNFKESSALSVTQGYNIYVSDTDKNEIYKFDNSGRQISSIGGYGWDIEAFDEPIDIFATPLNIYVADKNNNRIQIFDRELNFLSLFKTHENEAQEFSFSYPTCAAISTNGDLLILDSDNSRILKYDLNGNYLQQIGNYDAGSYKLNDPVKFSISRDGRIFVLDGNEIFIFDQFGTGISKIRISEDVNNISIYDFNLTLTSDKKIFTIDLRNVANGFVEFNPAEITENEIITDSAFFNDKLFILTSKRILEYSVKK